MKGPFTLNKNQRIKSRKVLDEIFQQGKSFVVFPYRVIYLPSPAELKFGVGVSTKNFKEAVDRNSVKRRTREVYRLQKNELEFFLTKENRGLNIFFVYTAKEILPYKQVFEAVEKIIKKLLKQANETNSAAT
jgi:ribonuclease P protein component